MFSEQIPTAIEHRTIPYGPIQQPWGNVQFCIQSHVWELAQTKRQRKRQKMSEKKVTLIFNFNETLLSDIF